MVNSEGVVALGPAFLKTFAASGVARVEISDAKAAWDFLIVWQRGKTSGSMRALLDALSTTVDHACGEAKSAR